MIIFAETAKPRIQAYKVLEDITSIIACQEKKLCLSCAICRYSMELNDSQVFLTAVSNLEILINDYITSSKQRFYTIKIILQDLAWKLDYNSPKRIFFPDSKFIASSYLNLFVFIELSLQLWLYWKYMFFPEFLL